MTELARHQPIHNLLIHLRSPIGKQSVLLFNSTHQLSSNNCKMSVNVVINFKGESWINNDRFSKQQKRF